MPRRLSCRSTIASRSDAKSVSVPTMAQPPGPLENLRAEAAVPMKEMELRFAGAVPEKYDELMVPLFFRPYANELTQRARQLLPCRILENRDRNGHRHAGLARSFAGFGTVEIETIELRTCSSSAHDVAAALCHGTPMGVEISERAPGSLDRIFGAIERSLQKFEGPDGVDAPMSAHIVTATR